MAWPALQIWAFPVHSRFIPGSFPARFRFVPEDNLESYVALPIVGEPSSWACLRAIQNYEAHIFEATGVMLDYTSIDTVRNTSLGIQGWALCNFGTDSSPPDDDSNDDPFPEDHGDNTHIKDLSQSVVGNGRCNRKVGLERHPAATAPVRRLARL